MCLITSFGLILTLLILIFIIDVDQSPTFRVYKYLEASSNVASCFSFRMERPSARSDYCLENSIFFMDGMVSIPILCSYVSDAELSLLTEEGPPLSFFPPLSIVANF